MSLNCVTGLKANEAGRLVKGVTLVTPVTPVLVGAGYVLSYCLSKLALHHIVGLWPDSTGRRNRLAESFSGAFSSIHNDAKKQLDIGSFVLEFVFILRQGHGGFGPAIRL